MNYQMSLFDLKDTPNTRITRYITSQEAWDFLKNRHYAGRKPQISMAFGWFINGELNAVCTFGKPASNSLCEGVCGKCYSSKVYELNRLCRLETCKHQLSEFVSACLRELKPLNYIIVSYSDTGMNHNGYIYQACNFIYTGQTKERTDKYTDNGKHSRHYKNSQQNGIRKLRTAKNRYVYFCCENKKTKKEYYSHLNYKILPYPKAQNHNYILGQFQKDILIDMKGNIIKK